MKEHPVTESTAGSASQGTAGSQEPADPQDRVRRAAAERGLEIEIRERPAAGSLPEAAALLGLPPSGIVKTLVVKRSDGTYLFALVPGGRAISWPKLRAVVGVNKLRLPEAELAFEATGFVRGTITPIGSTTDWPVFADQSITGRRVAMGAGAHGYSLFVDADELIRAYGATVADITVPED
ncbi:YbaK/EbsC family protein [Arthrobacter woluwensis]|nr:YbaK/EbsC family protein [Arthrobacter woluwensis]